MARSVCQHCGASFQGAGCHLCGDTLLTHAPKDPMLGKVFAGRYRIIRKLGQGGMGAVYLAEQVGIGHRVALKLLNANLAGNEEITQRFLNEAKSYARIAHPHAVAFHEFGQDAEGTLFISTEYIEGPDLKNYLIERGPLPVQEAVEITLQIADALEHAHQNGVIHRDLKPENVIVRRGMRGIHAKVLDFGIARLLEDGQARLTVAGSIAGTPQYMSPEQVRGHDVDARADVYVIGILLFELLTGEQPFSAATIPEMLYRQVHDPMPALGSDLPAHDALDRVIQRATAKDPAERYGSMAAFATELVEAIEELDTRSAIGRDTSIGTPVPPGLRPVKEGPQGTMLHGAALLAGEPEPATSDTLLNVRGETARGSLPASDGDTLLNVRPPAGGREEPGGTLSDLDAISTAAEVPREPSRHEESQRPSGPSPAAERERGGWGEPPSRQFASKEPKGRFGTVAAVLVVVLLAGGAAWALKPEWFSFGERGASSAEVVPAAAAVRAAAQEKPQPEIETKASGSPAAAPAPLEKQEEPEHERLRREFLAKEIWLKANAEFLGGNLRTAASILETVPEDESINERVNTLREQIEDVNARLARGRAAASRGDCKAAIAVYGQILTKYPGIREAARGQEACKRMLPPTLAE